ncbi:AraC family transcriptional regulator [Pseudonocardia sp. CA-107938]|uniref:AraC family transcriptional regulator n=1 Tax=Pseudonocardia sp. CA-107938 TaxID=3240021 RepID=UPI003D947288
MGEVARSSVLLTARRIRWDAAGVPVYGYRCEPGAPPVNVVRTHDPGSGLRRHEHAHDFVVLVLVEKGTGSVQVNRRRIELRPADLVIVGPGASVDPGSLASDAVEGRAVTFPPEVVTGGSDLISFVGGIGDRAHRVPVPEHRRAAVLARFADVERELTERPDGWTEAVVAHLTLLLIEVARIAPADPAMRVDPLLAAVLAVIDERYGEALAVADVAAVVGLSPGHLSTVVRRRSGRTVQTWIAERRMHEARRLLAETDLPVQEVAARIGIPDASYFIRRFRRVHGRTPLQWRRAGGHLVPTMQRAMPGTPTSSPSA